MADPTKSPDPLLKPGAFIDPNTPSNGKTNGKSNAGRPKRGEGSENKSVDVTDEANRPDWLPPGWRFKEFLRTSGASAGTRDKYFIDPGTNRRFRSRKEVSRYLENGTTPAQKRKSTDPAAADKSVKLETPKRKKTEAKPKTPDAKQKVSIDNFKFDEVPAKVTWVLTDVYEGTWGVQDKNGTDLLPESSKQEWFAAFRHLSLKNSGYELL